QTDAPTGPAPLWSRFALVGVLRERESPDYRARLYGHWRRADYARHAFAGGEHFYGRRTQSRNWDYPGHQWRGGSNRAAPGWFSAGSFLLGRDFPDQRAGGSAGYSYQCLAGARIERSTGLAPRSVGRAVFYRGHVRAALRHH